MVSMLKTLYTHKQKQRRDEMRDRAAKHQKKMAVIEDARTDKRKERQKDAYRRMGKKQHKD